MAGELVRGRDRKRVWRGMAFGLLRELAQDPQVTDVAVTCDGRVWADRGTGMREHALQVPFRSAQVVREYAVQLCAQLGCRLDDASPIADAANAQGVRVHAVIAPLVPQGAAISIRFPKQEAMTLSMLSQAGLFPAGWFPLIAGLVARRATILVTGGTGAGKTTLIKALLGQCDDRERIITVEEVRELGDFGHANHVSLVARAANVEGAGAVGLTDLVKATLRMRPDRVVLGECRGEEVVDLLRAFNSGHHGGMTTLHADDVRRIPARLIALGLLAGVSPQALAALAEGAFDVVLHVERIRGRRCITQIGRLRAKPDMHAHQLSAGGFSDGLMGETLAVWDGVHEPRYASSWADFRKEWSL
ncbi:CpaF family protein [Bifidobacterium scaligerum]|uniref:CpaF family protein n=1 Tax=Bifidobacterium scaligerum TaxID=2052656 RepID=UPI003F6DC21C